MKNSLFWRTVAYVLNYPAVLEIFRKANEQNLYNLYTTNLYIPKSVFSPCHAKYVIFRYTILVHIIN